MIITTTHRSVRGACSGALHGLAAVVAATVCGITVTAGPAAAKSCQTCEDKGAVVGNGILATGGTAGRVAASSAGNAALAAADVTRGQFALDAVAPDSTAFTWVRR